VQRENTAFHLGSKVHAAGDIVSTQIIHHFSIDIGAVCCSGGFEAILFGFPGDGEVRIVGAQSFQFRIDIAPAKLVAAVFLEVV